MSGSVTCTIQELTLMSDVSYATAAHVLKIPHLPIWHSPPVQSLQGACDVRRLPMMMISPTKRGMLQELHGGAW